MVRVGCSGWQYREWRGRFYPDGLAMSRWFAHYAANFDSVELNSTFYRLPSEVAVVRWREAAPPGFLYAVKLGAFGSHRKRLRDPESWLVNHLERVAWLGPALGPTLVQLPPRWRRDAPRLDHFLAVAPNSMRWAIEVRDPSWLHDDVFQVLHDHDAALCIHDLLPDHPWILTASWSYLRFHGPRAQEAPYRGRYTGRRLRRVAETVEHWAADGTDVYAYFNNDIDGAAPIDAAWLRDRVVGHRPSAEATSSFVRPVITDRG